MSRFRVFLPVVCAVLALGACGGTPTATSSGTTSSSTTSSTTTTTATTDPAAEEDAVRAVFEDYQQAVLAKAGGTAVSLLSTTVHPFYDEARRLALTGGEEEVHASGPSSAMTVYVMRHEFEAAPLRAMTPGDLVQAAVERGLIDANGTQNLSIGEITVTGDTAEAETLTQGKVSGFRFEFRKEDGTWRIDLRPLLALADRALEQLARQQGQTVEQLVDATMGVLYGADGVAALKHPLEG